MQSALNDIIAGNFFAFLLIFMRLGLALMIMPGIGDSFVTPQVRLLFALSMSLILTPVLATMLPPPPQETFAFAGLVISEAFIGIFIGTVMRILMGALDTAGMVVSMQAGFANAQIFNPLTGTQGSVMGSIYSMLGVTLLLVSDMHHYMLASVVESYQVFRVLDGFPDMGAMLEVITKVVSVSFKIGVQIAMPFLIAGLLVQIGFGILGRLMPQLQVFFLAMPLQIFLSLLMLAMTLSAGMLYWLNNFQTIAAEALAP